MSAIASLRVGLCGIGLDAYWPQFPGLKSQLEGLVRTVAARLRRPGVDVLELGLVDTAAAAKEAARQCRRSDIDLLFIYVTTYALSSTVLPLVQRAAVPAVILNLQPKPAIDYAAINRLTDRAAMTEHWLAYCSACPVPEIANVLMRARLPFHQVTGVVDEAATWEQMEDWLAAARVRADLRECRLGLMGHYYNGMLDVMTDLTQVSITFGAEVKMLEVDELSRMRAQVGESAVSERVAEFHAEFEVQPDCPEEELARAARTSVALDRFAAKHQLGALAYYYKGTGTEANEDTMSSIILGTSRLTARHIPVAGEYEVKNAIAMKIMDGFGAGGSFTEYYAVDFNADLVLMGHDGPGHIGIAEGKTKVRPLRVYHGKVGRGLSVEMSVRHGPVTLLSVVEDAQAGFKLLAAEGECEPGEILQIGNTNSRFRFPLGARAFIEHWNSHGPAHHCAVGIGNVANRIEKLARLLQIGFDRVC
jgi:L-arabinose isomerase